MKKAPFLKRSALLLAMLAVCFSMLTAQTNRPKVGLVLGGGGAKGAAEVGVLKAMEQFNIPIDYIAGTSIGSIVGGLYAMGRTPEELDSLFTNQDWVELFSGNVREFLDSITNGKRFEDLEVPFRCVATDVKNEREVVISSGPLGEAMRASMSIPGVFKPVKKGGALLMDGGLINNLPVDVVKAMGADIVIAIDLQQEQHENRTFSLKEKLGIGGALNWLISRPDWKRYNTNKQLADIYIQPLLEDYGVTDFKPAEIQQMIAIGYYAGMKAAEELKALKKRLEN